MGKCPDDAVWVCLLSLLCGFCVVVQAKGQRLSLYTEIINKLERVGFKCILEKNLANIDGH